MHFSQALVFLTAAAGVYSSPISARGPPNAIVVPGTDKSQGPPNALVIPRGAKRQYVPPPNALVVPEADESEGPPNALVIPGLERRDLPPPNALVVPTPDDVQDPPPNALVIQALRREMIFHHRMPLLFLRLRGSEPGAETTIDESNICLDLEETNAADRGWLFRGSCMLAGGARFES